MDEAYHRLAALIQKACGRREPDLDAALLSQVKAICRLRDENVLAAWEALWGQLRAPHAQSRLLALRLCAQLFKRSRAFRYALLARLSQFLEAVLGFRAERPLPPPAQAAASLREEALELLEAWSEAHGARHKQLPLAVRYLRDTLQYRFPEAGARAAAAEAEERTRQERQRAQLRQRLAGLLGGEWREGSSAARQMLLELEECFALLDEQQREQGDGAQQQEQRQQGDGLSSGSEQAAAADEEAAAAGGEEEWEDVAAGATPQQEQEQHEGLAAYAGLEEGGLAAATNGLGEGDGGNGSVGVDASKDAAVLETLAGLYRQLTNRLLPQVQEWLSVLGRVEPEGPQEEAQRQHLLRSTTELRGQLAAAKARCDAECLDLEALLLQRQRREEQQQREQQQAEAEAEAGSRQRQDGPSSAAVAAAMQDVFGESDSDAEKGAAAEGRQQRQRGAPSQRPRGQRQRQQRNGSKAKEEEDWESPYLRIVDPTAPRPRQQQGSSAPQQQKQPLRPRPPRPQQHQGSSLLAEEVRKKLAAQAPELPSGTHTMFWDSKSVPTFVSGHGMEISSHWGPVDVHQELPQERLDELFLLPMPSRQQPQQREGLAGMTTNSQQLQEQKQQQQPQPQPQDGGEGPSAAPAAAAAKQQPQLHWPSRQQSAAGAGASSSSTAAAAAAAAVLAGPDPNSRAAKRARRAQERAYNEAVIGGAFSDEHLARQLQDAEQQQQQQAGQEEGEAGASGGRGRRGRKPKKMSIRDRLAQKLLRGSAVAAALRDVTTEEGEMRRERAANRW